MHGETAENFEVLPIDWLLCTLCCVYKMPAKMIVSLVPKQGFDVFNHTKCVRASFGGYFTR